VYARFVAAGMFHHCIRCAILFRSKWYPKRRWGSSVWGSTLWRGWRTGLSRRCGLCRGPKRISSRLPARSVRAIRYL